MWHPDLAGIVMVGGGTDEDEPFSADTWLWRDDTWTDSTGAIEPSPRNGHALAYDDAREVIVLVGGVAEPGGPQILDVGRQHLARGAVGALAALTVPAALTAPTA